MLEIIGYQFFQPNGILSDSFVLGTPGPFTGSYNLNLNGREVILITNTAYCIDIPGETCLFQVYDLDGNHFKNFGNINQIDTESPGVPFYSTLIADSLLYIQHSLGKTMAVFNIQGQKMFDFSTSQSSETHPINAASLPNDVYQQVKQIKASSYTYSTGIFNVNNNILIQFRRSGEKFKNEPTHFLEIYDRKGKLKYYGMDSPYPIIGVNKNSIYFLNTQEQIDGSTYVIYHYKIAKDLN